MKLLKNATIVDQGTILPHTHLLIEQGIITKIIQKELSPQDDLHLLFQLPSTVEMIDIPSLSQGKSSGKKLFLIPGVIDCHVHFREPGLTQKGTIETETRASIRGGITSFMDMPNTIPPTLTQTLLEEKFALAEKSSKCNYSFYMGVSDTNLEEVCNTNPKQVCGAKIFLCHSTGNLKANNGKMLEAVFEKAPCLLATHCEDDEIVEQNANYYKQQYGENIPMQYHCDIRSEEACFKSTEYAISLAKKYPTSRLHVVHVTTKSELKLFENQTPLEKKRITCEVSPHHLWYDKTDYAKYKSLIKCNPSIKEKEHKEALLQALKEDLIDLVATDHAPHTWEEKQTENYFKAPSGIPTIQQSLHVMLEFVYQNKLTVEKVVQKMCHAPAICFHVEKRGFIREGYFADLVLIDLEQEELIQKEQLQYKCKWTPFEEQVFHSKILATFVNGQCAYSVSQGIANENFGKRLTFY